MIIENCPAPARILEAGCGAALLSLILADLGYQVTALDRSKDVLDYAKSRMVIGQHLRLDFVEGDLFQLRDKFKMREFEAVCHSGVMEHFEDGAILSALAEQKHVAKKLIFKVPNIRTRKGPSHFGDERLLANRHWVDLIRKSGFRRVEVFGDPDLPKYLYLMIPGLFFRFHPAISSWWKWFSGHTIFVCE
jgi:SAM-dependent methyltransferase